MESIAIYLLLFVLLCNFFQFFYWDRVKSFTLEKMKEFVIEVSNNNGFRKMCEYVMLHDKAMYKTNEKIEELVKENKMLKSEVESLKKDNDDLTKRLVFLEQQQKTPQKSPKGRKQGSR